MVGCNGEQINKLATATNTGYPAFSFGFGPKPESVTVAKDVAENVPWAAENVPVPKSANSQYVSLSLHDVNSIAESKHIEKPYTISMPQNERSLYDFHFSFKAI